MNPKIVILLAFFALFAVLTTPVSTASIYARATQCPDPAPFCDGN